MVLFFSSCMDRKYSPDAQYEKDIRSCYLIALAAGPTSSQPNQSNNYSTFLSRCLSNAESSKKEGNKKDNHILYYY